MVIESFSKPELEEELIPSQSHNRLGDLIGLDRIRIASFEELLKSYLSHEPALLESLKENSITFLLIADYNLFVFRLDSLGRDTEKETAQIV